MNTSNPIWLFAYSLHQTAIAEQERLIALQERHEKEKLAAYLRSLGINPNEI